MISSAEALRGTTGVRDLGAALAQLAGETYKGFLAVTDGPDGVYWLERGEVRHMPAFKVDAIDTLGAGDAFHGAFTFRLVETGDAVCRTHALCQRHRRAQMHAFRRRWRARPARAEVEEFLKKN